MSNNPYSDLPFHPVSEKLVNIMRNITGQENTQFYRLVVSHYMTLMASSMGACIAQNARDKKPLPVNMFSIGLAPSGTGKDFSIKIMEEDVMDQFIERFIEETVPEIADENVTVLANRRAINKGEDPEQELAAVQKEYQNLGDPVFTFDDATVPAVRQFRHKLLMAGIGAVNLQVNEIGTNITSRQDSLNLFIELYDGKLKPALTKNTQDNKRNKEIRGVMPANMLLFGTPASLLLPGSKLQEQFDEMLETGYARRCFFAYFQGSANSLPSMTPAEELERRYDTDNFDYLQDLSNEFVNLADPLNAKTRLLAPYETLLLNTQYKQFCEKRAAEMKDHEIVLQQEMKNRHFKVLKLAGTYAFIDQSPEITKEHMEYAIAFAEESGKSFEKINNQEKPYVKLAKFIADYGEDITLAEMDEMLPYYKGPQAKKNELMTLATSWGYKNNIIIKRSYVDGIEFLRGETLQKTDLARLPISYSNDIATGYQNEYAPFEQLHKLTQAKSLHWVNHFLTGGHRQEDNVQEGFSLLVLDVDGGVPIQVAQELLKDYKYLMYTTKRHDPNGEHRFRIVMPTNYQLELDAKDYKEFMANVFRWMPFEVDTATNQRARKWMSHNGDYFYNDGETVDVLPFIPRTHRNEEHKKLIESQKDLDNLERWVLNNSGDGNRNNMLHRYAMILVDAGFDANGIQNAVMGLNDKMPDKLSTQEIVTTVMTTVHKRLASSSP